MKPGRAAPLLALALSSCAGMSVFEIAGRTLMPDEVYLELGAGSFDGQNGSGYADNTFAVGLTWGVGIQQVEVVSADRRRSWTDPPAPEPAAAGVAVQEDGSIVLPAAFVSALVLAIGGVILRHFRGSNAEPEAA